jgi:predicted deacylase
VLHNAYIAAGILRFTPEIGAARRQDLEMIPIFVESTLDVLKPYGVIRGAIGRTSLDSKVYIGKNAVPVLTIQAGLIALSVKLDPQVNPGQKLAIQRNAFGEVLAEYTRPVRGRIGSLRTDATSKPGNGLVFNLTNDGPAAGAAP